MQSHPPNSAPGTCGWQSGQAVAPHPASQLGAPSTCRTCRRHPPVFPEPESENKEVWGDWRSEETAVIGCCFIQQRSAVGRTAQHQTSCRHATGGSWSAHIPSAPLRSTSCERSATLHMHPNCHPTSLHRTSSSVFTRCTRPVSRPMTCFTCRTSSSTSLVTLAARRSVGKERSDGLWARCSGLGVPWGASEASWLGQTGNEACSAWHHRAAKSLHRQHATEPCGYMHVSIASRAMPCHAMPCHAMPTPCHAMPCHTIPRHGT